MTAEPLKASLNRWGIITGECKEDLFTEAKGIGYHAVGTKPVRPAKEMRSRANCLFCNPIVFFSCLHETIEFR
jgi:hypothetical protein